jgi:parvulin-like peptidyl-prolyl isomerase
MAIEPRPAPAPRPAAPLSWLMLPLALGLAVAPAGAQGKPPRGSSEEEVVATVNGRPILRRDFDLAVQVQLRGRLQGGLRLEELRAVREKVLESLIDNEVLYQKAAKSRLDVPDADVEAEIQRIRAGFPDPGDFARVLDEEGVSEADFRDQVRRSILVTRFVEREVVDGVAIEEEDLRRYYDQNPGEMTRPEAARVSQIMVRVAADAPPEARATARQKIEEILKELRSGKDFADLARKYSEGPEADRGGDTGFVSQGGGAPPLLERAAFQLQPGQTSDIIETRIGFHILRVKERRPAGPIPFEEARSAIRAKLRVREREGKIRAYLAALKEKARVERRLPASPASPAPPASPAR